MDFRTYSLRVLCPYHGMLQVLSLPGGIAESTDGYHWKLYVHDERIITRTGLSEVRYGSWDPEMGSYRKKVRGTGASDLIEETGGQLIAALETHAHRVPYPPVDRHELWLLDPQQQPLALLDSAIDRPSRDLSNSPAWHPGSAASQNFNSAHGDAGTLTRLIRDTAGNQPKAIWVERDSQGSGISDDGQGIEQQAFPKMFLRSIWPEQKNAALIQAYFTWQAPWLLQLLTIDRNTRKWLERAAWQRPAETSRVFRLFPEVIDQQQLTTTRVRASIMRGSTTSTNQTEPFYPFFNE